MPDHKNRLTMRPPVKETPPRLSQTSQIEVIVVNECFSFEFEDVPTTR
jgi:hypothetical protein